MRLSRPLGLLSCWFVAFAAGLSASEIVLRPSGRLLFQPQLLWSNSMTTLEGTGFVIEQSGKYFGVTGIHFLDFEAGGLRAATWLDVYSERPLATFRSSLGRPLRTAITQPRHVADDFLLLPCATPPDDTIPLQLEDVARYPVGARLWFPNKNREFQAGHEWIDATVLEDLGYLIRIRLRDRIALDSQGGSPVLNADTGKVIGLFHRGEDDNGKISVTLCPARSILKFMSRAPKPMSLLTSIDRRR